MSAAMLSAIVVIVLALSAVSGQQAIQRRIALNPTGMTVSWSTRGWNETNIPAVIFGTSPSALNMSAKGVTRHYDPSITWFHHVRLEALQPATRYYWAVMTEPTVILSFVTAVAKGSPAPFTTLIYGDLGIDNSVDTLNLMRTLKKSGGYDMIFHVGDLNYADDYTDTRFTYEEITEGWMDNMTGIWDEQPYMLLPGNHEWSCSESDREPRCPTGQRNFSSFRLRYDMPHREVGSPTNMHYSYDYSYAHFVATDTETYPNGPENKPYVGPFGDQAAWLEADLIAANKNRATVPWIIAGGHRQYFSTGGSIDAQVKFFAPLFEKYNVDIVFCGHIHWYERLYALSAAGEVCTKSYQNPQCPIYVVTGAAGNIEGLTPDENYKNITAKIISEFGIGRLNIFNGTTALWEFVNSKTGLVEDSITIVKDRQQQAANFANI